MAQRLSPSGSVVSSHILNAFGTVGAGVEPDPCTGPWGQWGGYWDQETGLTLLTHRYYAGGGRFLTRDPLGYDGGINLYSYCGNDPVNESDPEGLTENVIHSQGDDELNEK